MKKITKLTEEQKAMMPVWAKRWIDIGLKTGDADWATFDKYMPECYAAAGLKYPKRVVRVPSPFFGAHVARVAAAIWDDRYSNKITSVRDRVVYSEVYSEVGSAVRSAVSLEVRSEVGSEVRSEVDSAVGSAVRSAVESAVDSAVRSEVGSAVRSAVRSEVGLEVRSEVGLEVDSAVEYEKIILSSVENIIKQNKLTTSWNYWLGGQFWVGGWWGSPSYVSFFTEVCGLELPKDIQERATAYQKVCESVNYIWPNRDFIVVCDRPQKIERDDKGRLHSLKGKAIEYKDGWGLYMIHGVKFTEQEFKDFVSGSMTAKDIMAEKNQDKKRVLAMEYGNERLIKELNAEICSEEPDLQGNPMRIYKIEMGKGEEHLVIYEGICPSKGEKIYLRVPPEFVDRSPWQAKCWTFPELYKIAENLTEQPQLLNET